MFVLEDSPVDPGDAMLPHYLIATWAKVCQAMGPEFEPYLPAVMPQLLRAASVKADVSIYGTSFSFALSSPSPVHISIGQKMMIMAHDG